MLMELPVSYLTSCPIWLLTYLAFAWVIALQNQVIRLAGHREFTSAWCPELKPCQEAQTLTEENFTHNKQRLWPLQVSV